MKGIVIAAEKDAGEIIALASSLGYEIVKVFNHKKGNRIGKGKTKEIKEFIDDNHIKVAFIDHEIKPSEWYKLEKNFGIDVYDRIRLILEVFADRANRKEARLQVKLAKLRYERPFVRELIHRVKEKERPGFLAGGEYLVDDYYEMIKRQMRKIKKELDKIREERELRRRERKERGFYLVSIAGYANAGKSSLLNILTNEEVIVNDKMFSTLSTITGKMIKFDKSIPVLITDTVGFIKDLPHWLIDAFHSTLEEIKLADVIILMLDASDSMEEIEYKLNTSLKEIKSMKNQPEIIPVLNKIDLIGKLEREEKKKMVENILGKRCVLISVKKKLNIDVLINEIYKSLPGSVKMELILPDMDTEFISWVYRNAKVEYIDYNRSIRIGIKCSHRIKNIVEGKCNKRGGKVILYENG